MKRFNLQLSSDSLNIGNKNIILTECISALL